MQITFNFYLSRNDLQKHKFGHKNKLKANQCCKIKLQNVSQLSLHRLVPKCAVASDSNNVSKLLSESLFLFAEKIMPLKRCAKLMWPKLYLRYKLQ